MDRLEKIYKLEDIKNDEKILIDGNINRILSHELINNVGLLYGKVQSGKTRNLICLTGKLLDNDFKLIIVMTANTNNLMDQNYRRFAKIFKNDQFKNDSSIIHIKELKSDSFDNKKFKYYYENNKKIIVFCLKHQNHIELILNKLKDTPYSFEKSIILDDEGDDITQNSAKNKFDSFTGEEVNRTAVNQNLVNLKNSLKCGLISITATPQSNLLLQPQQDLAPSWCETLNVSEDYCGLEDYLEDEESYEIVNDDWKKLHDEDGVVESLKNALSFFIVSSTIIRQHNIKDSKSQMLIHTDKKTLNHDTLDRKIRQILNHYFKSATFREEVEKKFRVYFDNIKKRYTKIQLNDYSYYEFFETIEIIEIIKLNNKSNSSRNINMDDLIEISYPHIIFIGAELLDRGITIPNLVTTYISRESKQIDTLLQRARWLGYRKDIFDLSKIFLTEKLLNAYQKIVLTNNYMLKTLEYCAKEKINLKDFNFNLRLEGNFNITNKNKAQWETYDPEWFSQSTPTFNSEKSLYNEQKIETFCKYLENQHLEYMNFKGSTKFINLISFLSTFYTYDKDLKFKNLINFLEDLQIPDNEKVEIVIMRNKIPEERSLKNNFQINNLFQGANLSTQNAYPGDRNLLKDKIQLQIHFVKIKNDLLSEDKSIVIYPKDTVLPMIAVGIPIKYRENKFIKRKDIIKNI